MSEPEKQQVTQIVNVHNQININNNIIIDPSLSKNLGAAHTESTMHDEPGKRKPPRDKKQNHPSGMKKK